MIVFNIKKVPIDWKLLKLQKVVDFQGGSQPPKDVFSDEEKEDYIRLVQIRDFKTDKYKTFIPISQAKRFFEKDDIMIGRYGPPVFQILRGLSGSYNVALMKAKPKEELDKDYLYYLLRTPNIQNVIIENSQRTAGQTGVNLELLNKIIVPLPPLDEQKRIAAVLDKAEALREKRRAAITKLDQLLQSVFLDMFGDPVSNPKGWNVKPLKDITNVVTDGVHAKPDYKDDGVPFISVKDITTKKLYFENCKFISVGDHEKFSKRCKAEYGDILYTKVGATYGRAAIVDTTKEFSLYVSVALIKPKKEIIDPFFLRAVMNSEGIKRQADKSIKGIGVPDLHLIEIKKFLVPVPSKDIQIDFVNKVSAIEKHIEKQKNQLSESGKLFQSLQQRAFAGELFGEKESETIARGM